MSRLAGGVGFVHLRVHSAYSLLEGALPLKTLVPSHGPVRADSSAIGETQRYLQWLDRSFRQLAEQGAEMNEVLRAEVPAEFRGWAAFGTEYTRNVAHLYPRYEQAVLKGAKP